MNVDHSDNRTTHRKLHDTSHHRNICDVTSQSTAAISITFIIVVTPWAIHKVITSCTRTFVSTPKTFLFRPSYPPPSSPPGIEVRGTASSMIGLMRPLWALCEPWWGNSLSACREGFFWGILGLIFWTDFITLSGFQRLELVEKCSVSGVVLWRNFFLKKITWRQRC